MHPRLTFERGTVRIDNAEMLEIPNAKFDARSKTLRAYGMHYNDIIRYLRESEIACDDYVCKYLPTQDLVPAITLRDYQNDAISRWRSANMRGCVILPTGSGKTAVGLDAICSASVPALVVVPTIDLMHQWASFLKKGATMRGYANGSKKNGDGNRDSDSLEVGMLGGGYDDMRAVTVATYDSAYIRAAEIGNRFGLLVFDEVHHLPAAGYRSIAEQSVAPFRLGLTATLEREDGLHAEIPRLAGGVVYRRGSQELAEKKHLAGHDVRRIRVKLTDAEQSEYARCRSDFLAGMGKLGMKSESMYNLRRLIMMSNRNKNARAALLARNRANEIAFNASSKISELQSILKEHCGAAAKPDAKRKKTLIFTQNNKMAYRISDAFLMPVITHKTSKPERRHILDGFRSGLYVAVVTSRVLDEGIDVPDAEIGIIVSGTGSGREIVQRLGRLLRPKQDGGRALLIEMVSDETRETKSSARRSAALRRNAAGNNAKRRTSRPGRVQHAGGETG